jgi:hypothetical protein
LFKVHRIDPEVSDDYHPTFLNLDQDDSDDVYSIVSTPTNEDVRPFQSKNQSYDEISVDGSSKINYQDIDHNNLHHMMHFQSPIRPSLVKQQSPEVIVIDSDPPTYSSPNPIESIEISDYHNAIMNINEKEIQNFPQLENFNSSLNRSIIIKSSSRVLDNKNEFERVELLPANFSQEKNIDNYHQQSDLSQYSIIPQNNRNSMQPITRNSDEEEEFKPVKYLNPTLYLKIINH